MEMVPPLDLDFGGADASTADDFLGNGGMDIAELTSVEMSSAELTSFDLTSAPADPTTGEKKRGYRVTITNGGYVRVCLKKGR